MSFPERLAAAAAAQEKIARQPRPASLAPFTGRATRNDFLSWIYGTGLVRADAYSAHCADKLFLAKLLETYAPDAYAAYHPRTFSIGELGENPSVFLKNLHVIAKPAAGMNGEGGRIYPSTYEFLAYLKKDPASFGGQEEASPLTGLVSSGERYLVQEKVRGLGPEIRVHTLGANVIRGATFTRWDEAWDEPLFHGAEFAMQDFLDLLPPWMKVAQAWSADLLPSAHGFRIIEINTNRGRPGQWSGDLSLPDVLQAYGQHLVESYGADFSQGGGPELLGGRGNLGKFIGKFGAEAWERHQKLRKSAEARGGEAK